MAVRLIPSVSRTHRNLRGVARSAALLVALAACALPAAAVDNVPPANPSLARLVQLQPDIGLYRTPAGRLTSVYGPAFSSGDTARESAAAFAARFGEVFGAASVDLRPGSQMTDAGLALPLLLDRETGQYAFTLVYYSQVRDAVPVFRAELRLLTRNEPGFPLVLAKSSLRELGNYRVPANWQAQGVTWQQAQDTVRKVAPEMVSFTNPRMVIWAGYDEQKADPRLAYEFIANSAPAGAAGYSRMLYLVDALSGAILFNEEQVLNVDVTGTVRGMATEGTVAEICANESSAPLPYARVTIGATTAFADINGAFTIPNAGSAAVTVNSPMSGRFFVVNDQAQASESLSLNVTPPGPADFVHNSANTNEFVRAEVNTYISANIVRDFALQFNPTYPVVQTQVDFPINANLAQTCNAFYDGASINFYRSGGGCPNTGFGTVVYHEYGHHLVASAGSGQGAYGEGMGDVMGVLITDNSLLAIGFQNNCSAGLRNANNGCTYIAGSGCSSCGSEIHACGQLISGCVWSVRTNLLATSPSTYRDIISALGVNSMPLHSGAIIDPSITIDYLTLDDGLPGGDGDINNGTPHYPEINAGFTAHNMPGPNLSPISFDFPDGRPQFILPTGGTTMRVNVVGVTGTPQPGTGMLFVNTGTGFAGTAMTQESPNHYLATFPGATCGGAVQFYVSAQSTTSATVTSPLTAPAASYTTASATGVTTAFADDFETNHGWTAGVAGDTATTGQWVRGDPIGTGAQPEDDHTPGAGVNCFFTGQGTPGGGVGQADVDNGITTLVSPVFDLTGTTSPRIGYWRWYSNDQGGAPNADTLVVDISNNGGTSWVNAETVGPAGPETSGGWIYHEINVSSILTATTQMRVRFIAGDLGTGSVVEAAVDDFAAFGFQCGPTCPGDWNQDGSVTSDDFFAFVVVFFSGNADFNHDGVTNSQDFFDFINAFFTPC